MTERVIIVTGASSGIGAACALRLSQAGNRVVGVSRSGRLPSLEPGTVAPQQLSARPLDIRDPAAVNQTVADVVDAFGRLDAVVSSAGIAVAGPLEDCPIELVRAQLETNVIGAVYFFRAAAPFLRRFAPSRLIHISSLAAHVALPYQSLYCASHFAMSGLCQSLRYELTPQGVRVILIEPGSVRTALTENRRTNVTGNVYHSAAMAALDVNDADERGGIDSDRVARVVEKMLTVPSPPDHQSVGHWHERITLPVGRFLPARVFRRIIESHYAGSH